MQLKLKILIRQAVIKIPRTINKIRIYYFIFRVRRLNQNSGKTVDWKNTNKNGSRTRTS